MYTVGDVSLEVLALHEYLQARLCPMEPLPLFVSCLYPQVKYPEYSAQVGFVFAGIMVDSDDGGAYSGLYHSRSRINVIEEAMQRHPNATVVIDAHVGSAASLDIAVSLSVRRGAVIAAMLVEQHKISVERITVRAWGKRLLSHARESSHPTGRAARAGHGWADLFMELEGTELPGRPAYYGHGVGCARELGGANGEPLAAVVSDAAAAAELRDPEGRFAAPPLSPPRVAFLHDEELLPPVLRAAAGLRTPPDSDEEEEEVDEDQDLEGLEGFGELGQVDEADALAFMAAQAAHGGDEAVLAVAAAGLGLGDWGAI